MGAFWIFAAILTFVYIVYYAVIMAMDTVGDKGKKKKDVEVFAVGNSSQEAFVEEPTFIKEKEALPDTSSAKQAPPIGSHRPRVFHLARGKRRGHSLQDYGNGRLRAICQGCGSQG